MAPQPAFWAIFAGSGTDECTSTRTPSWPTVSSRHGRPDRPSRTGTGSPVKPGMTRSLCRNCYMLNTQQFPETSFSEPERSDTEPPDYQSVKPHATVHQKYNQAIWLFCFLTTHFYLCLRQLIFRV